MPRALLLALPIILAGCAADRSAPARSVRPLAAYFSSNDYPASVNSGEEGTTAFRLTVAPTGRVSACEVIGSSGHSSLDSATCRVLQSRARFEPALDRKGRPTEDKVDGRVSWRLPED